VYGERTAEIFRNVSGSLNMTSFGPMRTSGPIHSRVGRVSSATSDVRGVLQTIFIAQFLELLMILAAPSSSKHRED
jgi:hypothetical protein